MFLKFTEMIWVRWMARTCALRFPTRVAVFSTKSKPCSGWSSGGGISTKGNVHFTWNDQFSFVAVQGNSAPLSLSFLRIDNSLIAEAEVGLLDLSDQRACHQWFQLGQTWRLYAALQFVSSPEVCSTLTLLNSSRDCKRFTNN